MRNFRLPGDRSFHDRFVGFWLAVAGVAGVVRALISSDVMFAFIGLRIG